MPNRRFISGLFLSWLGWLLLAANFGSSLAAAVAGASFWWLPALWLGWRWIQSPKQLLFAVPALLFITIAVHRSLNALQTNWSFDLWGVILVILLLTSLKLTLTRPRTRTYTMLSLLIGLMLAAHLTPLNFTVWLVPTLLIGTGLRLLRRPAGTL